MEYFLGLDNGGTVTKAALFDICGREIAVCSVNTEMLYPKPGFTERNLDALWEANLSAIRGVLAKIEAGSDRIRAVSVTGYGNGMILLGKDGKPVYNGIISTDYRARDIVDTWYADGTFEKVFPLTVQSMWPAQPVSLLAWFKKHMPEIPKRATSILMCKDYIRYRLTGEILAEISDYSGTSAIELSTGRYSEEALETMGIAEYLPLFPPLVRSTDICGTITREVADATGLSAGIPVAGGLFDIHSSSLASGVTEPGILSCVAGTWTINQVLQDRPLRQKNIFMNSISPVDGMFLVMEGSPTSTSNLEWFIRDALAELRADLESSGGNIYEYCNTLVDSLAPGDSEIIFLPFLYGSNVSSPSKAAFLGLEGWHERKHLIRAIYEGIIFATKMHIDRLLRDIDRPRLARLAGGPARSDTWVKMYADTLGMPVEVVKVSEMGALGAAMCASVAAGAHTDLKSAAEHMVVTGDAIEPDPAVSAAMSDKYELYIETLGKLKEG